MTTLALPQVLSILQASAGVMMPGGFLASHSLSPIAHESDNEVLHLGWHDAEGHPCSVAFTEGANANVPCGHYGFTLTDTEGEEIVLCPLFQARIDSGDLEVILGALDGTKA